MRLAFFLILIFQVSFLSQIQAQSGEEELKQITENLNLTPAQQLRVKQLIENKQQALASIAVNNQYDELQRAQKRSSIEKGFEHSILLLLDTEQRILTNNKPAQQRRAAAETIEQMKKDGYSQNEIVEYLNKQSKVKSIHE